MMRGRGGFWGGEPNLQRRPGSGAATLGRIVRFFTPYRGRLTVIAVAILVSVTIGVVNPILLKLIIDNLTGPRDLGLLYLQCGLMIVLPIITSLIGVWQSFLSNVVGSGSWMTCDWRSTATCNGCRCAPSPRREPGRSRAESATT